MPVYPKGCDVPDSSNHEPVLEKSDTWFHLHPPPPRPPISLPAVMTERWDASSSTGLASLGVIGSGCSGLCRGWVAFKNMVTGFKLLTGSCFPGYGGCRSCGGSRRAGSEDWAKVAQVAVAGNVSVKTWTGLLHAEWTNHALRRQPLQNYPSEHLGE